MQDDALRVQQTLAGDRQAFGFLVRKYWRPIYAQILSVIHNHADAEELTNDAFIEAYLDLTNLRRPSSFHNWLRQIARHRCLDWLRQRKEASLSLEDLSDEVEAYLYGESVEDQLLRQEQINKTLEAIGTLPEIDRCLMRDFYLEAEPYRILQRRYHLSKSAVRMRLFRARQKVKEQVKNLLSGFALLPWRDMGKLSLVKGGLEAVRMGIKVKLMAGGMAMVLMLGGAGILVWHFRQPERETESSETMISPSPQQLPSVFPTYSPPVDEPVDNEAQPFSDPVVEQNEDSEQEVDEFLDWLGSLEQESSSSGGSPTASSDSINPAEQAVRSLLDAGMAGDFELYASYFRGKAKVWVEESVRNTAALEYTTEEMSRRAHDVLKGFRIIGTEYLDSDHAIVYVKAESDALPNLANVVGHFTYYVDKYDDGWYITDFHVENERKDG